MTTHGFALEFEPVSVVNEAIQDGVGVSGIADQIELAGHRELARQHRRAAPVAVFEDFEQMVTGITVERFEAPVPRRNSQGQGQSTGHFSAVIYASPGSALSGNQH